ncbi:unnamed protein product [Arabidopsis halleri]
MQMLSFYLVQYETVRIISSFKPSGCHKLPISASFKFESSFYELFLFILMKLLSGGQIPLTAL